MTSTELDPTDRAFDRDTFEIELADLIDHAQETDVPIEGAYDMRTPHPEDADYTIVITEIAGWIPGAESNNAPEID